MNSGRNAARSASILRSAGHAPGRGSIVQKLRSSRRCSSSPERCCENPPWRPFAVVGAVLSFQNLQQDVEYIRMRLFDFVEQHDGIRVTPHLLRKLAAFLVADVTPVARRSIARHCAFHVLAHVDADHQLFVVEEKFSERASEFGFADARRSQKDK